MKPMFLELKKFVSESCEVVVKKAKELKKIDSFYWIPMGVATAAFLSLTACTQSAPQAPKAVNEAAAKQLAADPAKAKEASAYYARLGELLMMPEGAQYADQMFQKALKLDPTNSKAHFYEAFLSPAMTFKGFLPMVERLAASPQDQEGLENFRLSVQKLNMPEVYNFVNVLPAGEQPFTEYYDVERFSREKLLPAIVASIAHLQQIDTSQPLQLNFTPERAQIDPVRHVYTWYEDNSNCSNDPVNGWSCTDYNYNGKYADPKLPNQYFVDQYDLKIIESSLMAIADSIRVGTAYSYKDIEVMARRLRALSDIREQAGVQLSSQDVVGVVKQFNNLFVLESDQQLSAIPESTGQALRNMLDLANMQDQLCNSTARSALNSLIYPICLSANVASSLKMGLDLLAGPASVNLGNDVNGNSVNITADLSLVLKNPPKDLKALLPTAFDSSGNPINYPDPTFGGLFPNGDLIAKLGQMGNVNNAINQAISGLQGNLDQTKGHL
jgi:hypothetical protein